MIFTVTLNPSIDYVIEVDDFSLGKINHTVKEDFFPGGKGLNVSLILNNLGLISRPLGFYAGWVGEQIIRMAKERGVNPEFTKVANGSSRINIKMKDKEETQINGLGPDISAEDIATFYKKIDEVQDGDTLILSGSIPSSIHFNLYADILNRLKQKKVKTIVDTSGPALRECFQYHPFLIKPNNFELQEIYDVTADSDEELIILARRAQQEGARNVLVSMGKDGALLVGENGMVDHRPAPEGTVVNTVGAGDSMVAGFVAGYQLFEGNLSKAFGLSLASGSATSFYKDLATGEQIRAVFEKEGY